MRTAKKDDREALVALVRGAGLRVTSSRIAVLSALREAELPLSHADVAGKLQHLGMDRTTVYRNLIDLAEAGVLRRSDAPHVAFELTAAATSTEMASISTSSAPTAARSPACQRNGRLKPVRGGPVHSRAATRDPAARALRRLSLNVAGRHCFRAGRRSTERVLGVAGRGFVPR